MKQEFDHFAYGSNLSSRRLRARCPGAVPKAIGFVRGRQLRFHKHGRDGTAKADAFWTGVDTDVIWGVIYRIAVDERSELDRCESLGIGYREAPVDVVVGDSIVSTFLYEAIADHIDPSLSPASWYVEFVLEGIREHRLPDDYHDLVQTWWQSNSTETL